MAFQDILRMALSSLGANKLRSFLTMLGITVGVFSVIGVMTAISAVENSVEEGLAELGANTFQIQRDPAVLLRGPHGRRDLSNRKKITYEEALRFRRLMGDDVKSVGIEASDFGKQAVYAGRKTNPNLEVAGADQFYAAANGYNIAYGRNLTAEDVLYARNVIVAGPGIQEKLFPSENPVNKQIKLAEQTYTIIGVFEKKGAVFGQSKDDFAILPVTRFLINYGQERSLSISVQAKTKQAYSATMDKAIGAMRLVRGLAPEEGNDFDIRTNEALIKSFEEIASTIRIGAFIISFIALITAGIGIMNIMLVSVTERTKEIGIRKSIGAKKKNILTQFLIEAVFLSEVGGVFGILVGVAGGNIFASQFNLSFSFPWNWAIIGLVVCSAIGIGFGLYPAFKAASLDPIEALRFE